MLKRLLSALSLCAILSTSAYAGGVPLPLVALTNTPVHIGNGSTYLTLLHCYNPGTVVTYVQAFNTNNATVGTTPPVLAIAIPPGATDGFAQDGGIRFSIALSLAATTTPTGSTAPASALVCNVGVL